MHTLQFKIDCGATTCASAPGKFCRYLGVRRFGTESICLLFSREDRRRGVQFARVSDDGDPDGWAKRLPECLAAEVEE